jgi:hypothetical protein
MSKTHCKEKCQFIKHDSPAIPPRCLIYKKELKVDEKGYKRLKKCVRESRKYKVEAQVQDIYDFYNAFVCEMDIMFDNLYKLMKGEK